MSDFDINTNPVLQGLAFENKPLNEDKELGQDAFLRLMIAQLKHQDPLSPQENGEFIAQLAQFSSVEGITNLNTAVGDLASEFRSSQALQASSLVGRQVEVNSNAGRLNEGSRLRGTVEVPAGSENVRITVENLNKEVMFVQDLSARGAGEVEYSWDGIDQNGEQQPAGTYIIKATAIYDGESVAVPVRVAANVNSVSIGTDNAMILNVDGIGQVPVDAVRRFM